MSTTTTNLHLIKPALSDAVNIENINDNMDTIDTAFGELINTIYPIGSIYMSVSSTNPRALFGVGDWDRILDTFLLAAGSTYVPGATGGEATHALTENELPEINRAFTLRKISVNGNVNTIASSSIPSGSGESAIVNGASSVEYQAPVVSGLTASATSTLVDIRFGGGQPSNNMPPYLAVYVWKRTA